MALPWAFTLDPFGMIRSMPILTGIGLQPDNPLKTAPFPPGPFFATGLLPGSSYARGVFG